MAANCVWSASRGVPWNAALNELVPISEMYGCFWIASRTRWSGQSAQRLLCFILVLVAIRGLWQLGYFALGKADLLIPPVSGAGHWAAEDISGYAFTRLFDPVTGIHAAIAFALYWNVAQGWLRRLAVLVMGVGVTVLILGLTRAEWIGTVICIILVVAGGKKPAHGMRHVLTALGVLVISGIALSLFFQKTTLDLGDVLATRAFTYTQQQLFDPRDSRQDLRLLEIATATDAFRTAPLFGHGLGSDLGTLVSDSTSVQFASIHNYYLNLLANAGLAGLLLFVLLAARVGIGLRWLARSAQNSMQRCYLAAATVGLIWYGVLVCFHPIFSAYHIPSLLGFYMGVAVSLIPMPGSASNLVTPNIPPHVCH